MAVRRKWDAIHEFFGSHSHYVQSSASDKNVTCLVPIVMNDDALGDPMSFNANPEHASWSEVVDPNCYPDSEIKGMKIIFNIIANETTGGSIPGIVYEYALVSCAFPEDLDAIDEKSGLSVKQILELQHESTDRQCYPLWSATDFLDGSTLSAKVPGLTASQTIESVDWDPEVVSDQRKYGKVKGLLKKFLPIGIKRGYIQFKTIDGGHRRITINFIPSNAKYINPYTGLFLMFRIPQANAIATANSKIHQPIDGADVSADLQKIILHWHVSYFERNPEFHMAKV